MNMHGPCKDCPDRFLYCHDICDTYQAEKQLFVNKNKQEYMRKLEVTATKDMTRSTILSTHRR